MLIVIIFIAIVAIMIYIYGGLKLAEDLDTPSAYSFFWVAYILFGFTLGTIIMLGNFWSVLVNKTGPPGARGIPGQQGDAGLSGECEAGHNTYYAMKQVKQAIMNTILDLQQSVKTTGRIPRIQQQTMNQITADQIYDPTANRLTNIFLDNTVDRMITSKQFEILLELPKAELQKLPAGKRKTFAKSLEDLSGYLAGTWQEWITGFYTTDAQATIRMVSTTDNNPEDQPKLAEYLNQEIEKYDIWYWGTTRVFRPLKAEICRAGTITYIDPKTGKQITRANTRFPKNLRPRLEIREVEYSDKDTSNLEETWTSKDLLDATPNKWNDWKNHKNGVYGVISKPRAMMPKIIQEGNKIFYPIGQVFIEGDEDKATNVKKKTILVSGDVIIADITTQTWTDRKKRTMGAAGYYDGDRASFFRGQSSQPGYVCLGDYFDRLGDESEQKLRIKYNYPTVKDLKPDQKYKGIVCLPAKCLMEIPRGNLPVWGYQFYRGHKKRAFWITDVYGSKDMAATYNILRTTDAQYYKHGKRNKNILANGKFYRIKPECLANEDIPVKEPEPEFTDLGMGWFGHPYKTDRKYSIFAFLGIMPEGIILHRLSGQRLYIRHYGGMEPNRFVVLNWDSSATNNNETGETGGFNRAIRAKSSSEIDIVELNLTDERQNWRLDTIDKTTGNFRLASIMFPRKFIALTTTINNDTNYSKNTSNTDLKLLRPPGVSADKTRMVFTLVNATQQPNPQTIFTNLPAFGTDTDILDEPSAKPIDRRKSMREQQSEERARGGQDDFSYINRGFNVTKTNTIDRTAIQGNVIKYTT